MPHTFWDSGPSVASHITSTHKQSVNSHKYALFPNCFQYLVNVAALMTVWGTTHAKTLTDQAKTCHDNIDPHQNRYGVSILAAKPGPLYRFGGQNASARTAFSSQNWSPLNKTNPFQTSFGCQCRSVWIEFGHQNRSGGSVLVTKIGPADQFWPPKPRLTLAATNGPT